MSKLTALLTTLALGASASIAMASPARSYDRRADFAYGQDRGGFADRNGFVDRGYAPAHRFDRGDRIDRGEFRRGARDDFGPRRYRPTWVALGSPLQLGRGGQSSIEVNDRGTFTQLRLQSAGGIAPIDRVIVQFADGSEQVADVDRVLGARDGMLEIQLDGNNRRIDRILVLGAGGARGALQVFGI